MSIEITWVDGQDMDDGLALVHQVGNEATIINMDWEDVDSAISLMMAHRELRSAKNRVRNKEEAYMSYGGTA